MCKRHEPRQTGLFLGLPNYHRGEMADSMHVKGFAYGAGGKYAALTFYPGGGTTDTVEHYPLYPAGNRAGPFTVFKSSCKRVY
jgi:hypothetical protein